MKNELLGMLVTALSVLAAAVVSGLRLKPYLDAGDTYTPASFMLYPAIVAIAIAGPLVFLIRRLQGKNEIEIGPLVFKDRTPFMALWCVLYIVIALTFFPYEGSSEADDVSVPGTQEEAAPLHQTIHLPIRSYTHSPNRPAYTPTLAATPSMCV